MQELRRLLRRGVRFLLARKLPAWLVDGGEREVFDRVVHGIQNGDLGDPGRLLPYVRMHLIAFVREIEGGQMATMPTGNALSLNRGGGEGRRIMQDLLRGLPLRARECLFRFYVWRHDDERICRGLGMPPAESRSLRGEIRARFRELCRQSFRHGGIAFPQGAVRQESGGGPALAGMGSSLKR